MDAAAVVVTLAGIALVVGVNVWFLGRRPGRPGKGGGAGRGGADAPDGG